MYICAKCVRKEKAHGSWPGLMSPGHKYRFKAERNPISWPIWWPAYGLFKKCFPDYVLRQRRKHVRSWAWPSFLWANAGCGVLNSCCCESWPILAWYQTVVLHARTCDDERFCWVMLTESLMLRSNKRSHQNVFKLFCLPVHVLKRDGFKLEVIIQK